MGGASCTTRKTGALRRQMVAFSEKPPFSSPAGGPATAAGDHDRQRGQLRAAPADEHGTLKRLFLVDY
jgi:hypothetical protein